MEGKRDLALEGFQNRTRVITERAAEVIARRGRLPRGAGAQTQSLDDATSSNRSFVEKRKP